MNAGDVTVTIYRDEQAITCVISRTPLGLKAATNIDILSITEAIDEDGNAVRLTQWEEIQACQLARAGVDETGH